MTVEIVEIVRPDRNARIHEMAQTLAIIDWSRHNETAIKEIICQLQSAKLACGLFGWVMTYEGLNGSPERTAVDAIASWIKRSTKLPSGGYINAIPSKDEF